MENLVKSRNFNFQASLKGLILKECTCNVTQYTLCYITHKSFIYLTLFISTLLQKTLGVLRKSLQNLTKYYL